MQKAITQRMTPSILSKSKNLVRNSSNFEDRLYHNPIREGNDYDCDNIYRRSPSTAKTRGVKGTTPSYVPELNKKSLQIASGLEPSIIRWTTKKKKNIRISTSKHGYSFDLKHQTNTSFRMSNKSRMITRSPSATSKASKRCDEMYQSGIARINNRQKAYEDNLKSKENEYKKYSFKPQINNQHVPTSKTDLSAISKNNYQKQMNWKMKIDKCNNDKKTKKEREEISKCTFTPSIEPLPIENDEKFISQYIDQMNQYVNKRRRAWECEKEYEQYKSRKFGKVGNKFKLEIMKPKRFLVEPEKSRSKSKERTGRKGIYSNTNISFEAPTPENAFNKYNVNNKNFIDIVNQWHLRIENWKL